MTNRQQTMVTIRIEAKLQWQMARDPESGSWIGICPALNLNALGDTWVDLLACANDATATLFLSLFNDRELESFLRQRGWVALQQLPKVGDRVHFEVPFNILQQPIESIVATA